MKCPNCGGEILQGMPMCPRCGQQVSSQAQRGKYCVHCKAVIPANAVVCPKCGRSQVQQQAAKKPLKAKKPGGFRWWYVPIMVLLVMMGYVIGFNTQPKVETKEQNKAGSSSSQTEKEVKNDSSKEPKSEDVKPEDPSQVESTPLTAAEIKELYSDPDKFSGRTVELTGKVFSNPEYDANGVGFQMWGDPANNDQNTMVAYPNKDIEISEGDYVKISGIVNSTFTGANAFGGVVTAPLIYAQNVEIVSYQDVISPTIRSIVPENNSQTQLGYTVTVQKIELAASETRVYLKVENNGTDKFNLYSFNSTLVQNGKQYEEQHNYTADYPEVQTSLLVGVSTEGVICFPAIEDVDFQLVFEARSENYSESFEPYTYNIAAG